jgi:hypothetical protein
LYRVPVRSCRRAGDAVSLLDVSRAEALLMVIDDVSEPVSR